MKLSVIIPVFNARQFLKPALESLLAERLEETEILVVDDGSTDGSLDTIRGLPHLTLLQQENRGTASARNAGIRRAKGEWIGFLDADDCLAKNGMRWRLDYLHSNPQSLGVMGSLAGFLGPDGKPLGSPLQKPPSRLDLDGLRKRFSPLHLWQFVFRRSLVEKVGLLDETADLADDLEFQYRILKVTSLPAFDLPTVWRRIHGNNRSLDLQNGQISLSRKSLAQAHMVDLAHRGLPEPRARKEEPAMLALFKEISEGDRSFHEPSYNSVPLPRGASYELAFDHPRCLSLREKYRGHPATFSSLWSENHLAKELEPTHFRGDNAFMWQKRSATLEPQYLLSAYYLQSLDRFGWIQRLEEDDAFGVHLYPFYSGKKVSRDLLDSIAELYFLEDSLRLSARLPKFSVLDIGAGYGRFAHRLCEAYPHSQAYCTDAVPESSFLCEYYLRYRGLTDRAKMIPLDELATELPAGEIDLAVNMHSFSEVPLSSIEWWLDLLCEKRVPYLMMVPNPPNTLLSLESDFSRVDIFPALTSRGFQLIADRPKYYGSEAAQKYGIFPSHHFLFERRA